MPVVYPQQYQGAQVDPFAAFLGGAMQGHEESVQRKRLKKADARADEASAREAEAHDIAVQNEGYERQPVPEQPARPTGLIGSIRHAVGTALMGGERPAPRPVLTKTGPSSAERAAEVAHGRSKELVGMEHTHQAGMQDDQQEHGRSMFGLDSEEQWKRLQADLQSRKTIADLSAGLERDRISISRDQARDYSIEQLNQTERSLQSIIANEMGEFTEQEVEEAKHEMRFYQDLRRARMTEKYGAPPPRPEPSVQLQPWEQFTVDSLPGGAQWLEQWRRRQANSAGPGAKY